MTELLNYTTIQTESCLRQSNNLCKLRGRLQANIISVPSVSNSIYI